MTEEKRVQLILPADDNDPWEIARVTPSVRWEQCVAQRDEGQSASVHAISTKAPGRPSSPSTGPWRNTAARRTGPCRCAPWPGPWAPAPSGGPAVATPQDRHDEVAQPHTNWTPSNGGRRCATHSTTTWGCPRSCTWRPRASRRCSSLGRKMTATSSVLGERRKKRPILCPFHSLRFNDDGLNNDNHMLKSHGKRNHSTHDNDEQDTDWWHRQHSGPQQLNDQAHVEDLLLVEQELPRGGLEEPTRKTFKTKNCKTTRGVSHATPTAVFPLTCADNRYPNNTSIVCERSQTKSQIAIREGRTT